MHRNLSLSSIQIHFSFISGLSFRTDELHYFHIWCTSVPWCHKMVQMPLQSCKMRWLMRATYLSCGVSSCPCWGRRRRGWPWPPAPAGRSPGAGLSTRPPRPPRRTRGRPPGPAWRRGTAGWCLPSCTLPCSSPGGERAWPGCGPACKYLHDSPAVLTGKYETRWQKIDDNNLGCFLPVLRDKNL